MKYARPTKTNIVRFHFYVESKNSGLPEVKSGKVPPSLGLRMKGACEDGVGVGEYQELLFASMVATVTDTVLSSSTLSRKQNSHFLRNRYVRPWVFELA
jgi:hypothetical protein